MNAAIATANVSTMCVRAFRSSLLMRPQSNFSTINNRYLGRPIEPTIISSIEQQQSGASFLPAPTDTCRASHLLEWPPEISPSPIAASASPALYETETQASFKHRAASRVRHPLIFRVSPDYRTALRQQTRGELHRRTKQHDAVSQAASVLQATYSTLEASQVSACCSKPGLKAKTSSSFASSYADVANNCHRLFLSFAKSHTHFLQISSRFVRHSKRAYGVTSKDLLLSRHSFSTHPEHVARNDARSAGCCIANSNCTRH